MAYAYVCYMEYDRITIEEVFQSRESAIEWCDKTPYSNWIQVPYHMSEAMTNYPYGK